MKKRISIILCAILAAALLTACAGAADHSAPMAAPMQMELQTSMGMYWEAAGLELADADFSMQSGSGAGTAGESIAGNTAPDIEGFAEKIIYNVHAEVETVKFEETITGVNNMIASYNAFIENSSISGQNYASQFSGRRDYRSAHFTIRVPKEHLDAMTGRLDGIGNVTYINSNATNITSQFIDTQSRLNSLAVEEERLREMLSKAEDIPDLIMIEERMSHVRYQIESLTSILKNWQNQVDYSTLTLSIREVEQYTERPELNRSYWQQIGDGFMSTMRGVGRFFMNFFKWLIIAAPVLVILAVIAVVTTIIVRRKLKDMAKKKANTPKPPPYQYPPVYGQNYTAPPTNQAVGDQTEQENQ